MLRMFIAAVVCLTPLAAAAAPCPGNPDALGTERVMIVDAASTPEVLAALKHECVKATFFLVGRNVAAHPALARRELADGHSIGNHTYSHPLLNHLKLAKAEAEIARGFAADNLALYGGASSAPTSPFFRFPGFASSPALLDWLQARGTVVFGADVWASDWNEMTPDFELTRLMRRIAKVGRGIVLLHDTKAETARMLPAFLRALKKDGYRIVHVVPAASAPPARPMTN